MVIHKNIQLYLVNCYRTKDYFDVTVRMQADRGANPPEFRLGWCRRYCMHKEKNLLVAYILWLLLGIFGAHKFYLSRPLMGLLYICTAGLFVIGWLIDLFTLPQQVDEYNEESNDYYEDHEDEIEDLLDEISELREMVRSDDSTGELSEIKQRLADLEKMVSRQDPAP